MWLQTTNSHCSTGIFPSLCRQSESVFKVNNPQWADQGVWTLISSNCFEHFIQSDPVVFRHGCFVCSVNLLSTPLPLFCQHCFICQIDTISLYLDFTDENRPALLDLWSPHEYKSLCFSLATVYASLVGATPHKPRLAVWLTERVVQHTRQSHVFEINGRFLAIYEYSEVNILLCVMCWQKTCTARGVFVRPLQAMA